MKLSSAALALLLGMSIPVVAVAKNRAVRGEGLSSVWHDSTLRGDGTSSSPLGVAPFFYISTLNGKSGNVNITAGQGIVIVPTGDGFAVASSLAGTAGVASLNGLTGSVTLTSSNGTGITTSGNSIIINAPKGDTGPQGPQGVPGSGGVTLPFNVDGSYGTYALSIVNRNGTALAGSTWGSVAAGVRGDAHTSTTFGIFGSNDASGGVGIAGSASDAGNSVAVFAMGGRTGVYGRSNLSNGTGLYGDAFSGAAGVYATSNGASNGYAGLFSGNVAVSGTLSKAAGSFKIDHPLDPENKYLSHSFVESPDMKNIYDGVVALDQNGEAIVRLPEWFEALNHDFRYQLTCVGSYAPVYIVSEVSGNEFKIAGGRNGLRVSWQVTGTRHDRFAEAHRIQVEELKDSSEQGKYLHPELYGRDQEDGVAYRQPPTAAGVTAQQDKQ